jgi:hypothetical protein
VGDEIAPGKIVSAFSLWDPLSDSGVYIAANVGFANGQRAVVRAR